MISVTCPSCGAAYPAIAEVPGSELRCPCGQTITVPGDASLPALLIHLRDEDAAVRQSAITVLARTFPASALESLRSLADTDGSPEIRSLSRRIIEHLEKVLLPQDPRSDLADAGEEEISKALGSSEPARRIEALTIIGKRGTRDFLPRVLDLAATEEHPHVQATIAKTIGFLGTADELEAVERFLGSQDQRVRANAVEALSLLNLASPPLSLVQALGDPDNRVRANAAKGLSRWNQEVTLATLQKMMSSPVASVRDSAVHVLSTLALPTCLPLLGTALMDEAESVRAKARMGLQALASREMEEAQALLDSHPEPEDSWEKELSVFAPSISLAIYSEGTKARAPVAPTKIVSCPSCGIELDLPETVEKMDCLVCGTSLFPEGDPGDLLTQRLIQDEAAIQEQLRTTRAEESAHADGPVKELFQIRIQVLENTLAMLQQKRLAAQHSIEPGRGFEGKAVPEDAVIEALEALKTWWLTSRSGSREPR